MSDTTVSYSDYVLKTHFGDLSLAVVRCMHICGRVSLKEIERSLVGKVQPRRISSCIMTLLRHRILTYFPGVVDKYNVNYVGISHISRIPIYCKLVLLFYGAVAEDIILSIFASGMAKCSEILRAAFMRSITENNDMYKRTEILVDTLESLVKSGVVKACKKSCITEISGNESTTSISKKELLENLQKFVSSGSKMDKFRSNLPPHKTSADWDLILSTDFGSLETLWRDRIISQLVAERIDETAGSIMSRILCIAIASRENSHILSVSSEGVAHSQLIRSFKETPTYLDSYITLLLDDDFSFIEQKPGITGGIYICPYKKILKHILIRQAENMVQVLYENPGLRIFRILIAKGYLPHDALESKLLIPQHEFRKVLPQMVAAGFISTTEFSKAKDFNADTITCLYHVNLSMLARLTIEYAHHALLRIGLRYNEELNDKARLIEQRHRIETLVKQHQEKISILEKTSGDGDLSVIENHKESVQALQSSLIPAEISQLSTLTGRLTKLSATEWEADTASFIADLYLRLYCKQ